MSFSSGCPAPGFQTGLWVGGLQQQPIMDCPMLTQAVAEYIWLDSDGQVRSRTKVLEGSIPQDCENLPCLVVDARVPGDAEGADDLYEVVLRPRKIFKDPFRSGNSILVLCDAYEPPATSNECRAPSALPMEPLSNNSRAACEGVMKGAAGSQPVLSCEQEYFVVHPAYPTLVPMGPAHRFRAKCSQEYRSARSSSSGGSSTGNGLHQHSHHTKASQGKAKAHYHHHHHHYDVDEPMDIDTGLGNQQLASPALNRQIADMHLRACLYAGIRNSGGGASSSTSGAWCYKIGPCRGTDFGDDVWVSRYLLTRIAEQLGAQASFNPGQAPGVEDCSSISSAQLGCHVKFSTAETRDPTKGLLALEEQLSRLQAQHVQHAWTYSNGRLQLLLSNKHLVSFVYAVANCSASVMVPSMTMLRRSGYYVDRRPPADCDPYKVAMLLTSTALDVPLPLYAVAKAPALDLPSLAAQLAMAKATGGCSLGSPDGRALWRMHSASLSGISEACGSEGEDMDGTEDDEDDASLDTDDLLLDELEKMDGALSPASGSSGTKASRLSASGCSSNLSGAAAHCEVAVRGSEGRCASDASIPHLPRAGTGPQYASLMATLGMRYKP